MRRLRSQKGQWLLAMLLRNHETVERARLAALLWPDTNETKAFASLRQSLADLRNALGEEAERLVSPTPQSLCFDCKGADIDILEFDRLIALGDNASLERAITLYRGPFLEGCHEEWVVLEREQRERSYRTALERLAQHTSARRNAIRTASQQQEQEAQTPEPLALIDTRARTMLRVASADSLTSNRIHIPQPLTALVGRQQEAREVTAQLKATRLVTLLGTGGVGKTRLALHVAETCGDANPDGVWFVDLATVSDGNSIPYTVAAALGIREEPGQSVLRTLQQVLATRQMLLLLDNCEHVLNSCAEFTETLLQTCPGLRILATSQHAFGVSGECGWRVPPLPVPELLVETQTVDPAALLAYDAVRLFVERAQSISPGFTLKAENAAVIIRICRQLDGIPLALEFAAARVNVLAVEQIADGLADRFRLLSARNALAGSRQKSLLSAMEWSWSLLSEAERTLMMRLSLFAGGATLSAATAICAAGVLEADAVLDTLDQLCDKSFVLVEEHGGEAFYRLLETTRAYAREQLLVSDDIEALKERHARYFLDLAEEARSHIEGAEQRIWLDRLSAAQEDLRSAFDYFVLGAGAARAANEGIRFAAAFWKYWHTRGSLSEGQRLLTLALERAPEISPARVMALGGAGVLALEQGDAGMARRLFSQCLQDAETLQDRPKILWVCNQLGRLAEHDGDPGTAQGYYQQCLDAWTEIGEWRGRVAALNNLGLVAQGLGDYAAATEYHIRCKAINQEFGNSGGIAWSNNNLGELAYLQGDLQTAWAYFQEGLTHFAALKNVRGTTTCVLGLATCLLREGNPAREWERATRLFSAAFALRAAIGVNPPLAERIELEQKLARIRTNLEPQKFALAWQEGERMSLEEATAYAMGKSEFLAQPTASQERLLERHLG